MAAWSGEISDLEQAAIRHHRETLTEITREENRLLSVVNKQMADLKELANQQLQKKLKECSDAAAALPAESETVPVSLPQPLNLLFTTASNTALEDLTSSLTLKIPTSSTTPEWTEFNDFVINENEPLSSDVSITDGTRLSVRLDDRAVPLPLIPDGNAFTLISATRPPRESRCLFPRPGVIVVIEATEYGLYKLETGWQGDRGLRRTRQERNGWIYPAVCASDNGKIIYCTRVSFYNTSFIDKYTLDESSDLKLDKMEQVSSRPGIRGISLSSTTNRLAALHMTEGVYITLHSSLDLSLIRRIEQPGECPKIMARPIFIDWSDDESEDVFISEWGESTSIPPSVMRLHLGGDCLEQKWTEKVEEPWNVKCMDGRVYVTGRWKGEVTVLSGADGSKLDLMICQAGRVRDVHMRNGSLATTSYLNVSPAGSVL